MCTSHKQTHVRTRLTSPTKEVKIGRRGRGLPRGKCHLVRPVGVDLGLRQGSFLHPSVASMRGLDAGAGERPGCSTGTAFPLLSSQTHLSAFKSPPSASLERHQTCLLQELLRVPPPLKCHRRAKWGPLTYGGQAESGSQPSCDSTEPVQTPSKASKGTRSPVMYKPAWTGPGPSAHCCPSVRHPLLLGACHQSVPRAGSGCGPSLK